MRIAALCDIHGNAPALEAVLREVVRERIDHLVVGGDVVPGPLPAECVALLDELDLPWSWLYGNGETDVVATRRTGEVPERVPPPIHPLLHWSAERLDDALADRMAGLPATIRIDGAPDVLFCHATPGSDFEIFTADTPEELLAPVFEPAGAALVVCGHTHMPFDRRIGAVRVVNPGSVGLPFGATGAYWAIVDGDEVDLRRTEYDLVAAEERLRASEWPGPIALRDPPMQAAMLAAFRAAEIGRRD